MWLRPRATWLADKPGFTDSLLGACTGSPRMVCGEHPPPLVKYCTIEAYAVASGEEVVEMMRMTHTRLGTDDSRRESEAVVYNAAKKKSSRVTRARAHYAAESVSSFADI